MLVCWPCPHGTNPCEASPSLRTSGAVGTLSRSNPKRPLIDPPGAKWTETASGISSMYRHGIGERRALVPPTRSRAAFRVVRGTTRRPPARDRIRLVAVAPQRFARAAPSARTEQRRAVAWCRARCSRLVRGGSAFVRCPARYVEKVNEPCRSVAREGCRRASRGDLTGDDGRALASMATDLLRWRLRTERDALLAQRRTGDLAALFQLTPVKQISLSVAVWELARLDTPRGTVGFGIVDEDPPRALVITVAGVPLADPDLAPLRHLVEGTAASEIRRQGWRPWRRPGAAVVQLTAPTSADASVPGIDGLKLVVTSLVRHD